MHPDLERRMQMGQLHHAQRVPPEKRAAIDRTKLNPLPPTKEGTAILQQLHGCPMVTLTKQLDIALRQELDKRNVEEVDRLTAGTKACIMADIHCSNNLSVRTAVRFQDDDELMAMTQQLEGMALEASSLSAQLQQIELNYNQLEHDRFQKAAIKYGLNLKERSYRLNEKEECIELIEPKCTECAPVNSLKDLLAPKSQEEKAIRGV
jgi:hypothetical protein